jgi:hypothetical protein
MLLDANHFMAKTEERKKMLKTALLADLVASLLLDHSGK